MKKKITLLVASLLFLAGNSRDVWAQSYLGGATDVNNDFGAGESATIQGTDIVWPATQTIASGTDKIVLGGASAQNSVIRVYNGNGYGIGWVSVMRIPSDFWNHTCGNTWGAAAFPAPYNANPINGFDVKFANSPGESPDDYKSGPYTCGSGIEGHGTRGKYQHPIVYSFNSFNQPGFSAWGSIAPCGANLFESSLTGLQADGSATIRVWHHITNPMLVFQCNAISAPIQAYTSTQGPQFSHTPGAHGAMNFNQDEVKLTQFKGSQMQDAAALNNQKTPLSVVGMSSADDNATNWYIDNYTRPTTIGIQGITELNTIQFNVIDWSYEVNYVAVNEVASYTGLQRNDAECNSGLMRAYAFEPSWSSTMHNGVTKPDAAVQLINGARVCIKNDVKDLTGKINSKKSSDATSIETNALIALPKDDRITLRTGGDFQSNMTHEKTLATTTNVKYTTAQFPDPDADIFMYANVPGTDIQLFGSAMKAFANANYTSVSTKAPYTRTASSVFGVNGNYLHTGNMAEVHTDFAPYSNSNPGIIEVGTLTQGKSHFHIYGKGMLKDYQDCNIAANFPLFFGHLKGGTPQLQINTADTLFVVNFGSSGTNFCDADLLFHSTSVDSFNLAFQGTGDGALQVQAVSDLRLRGDGVWDASANGNNIFLLSDGGNISTQKLEILNDHQSAVGQGLITFWAETSPVTDACAGNHPTNRFSKSGNIYFNDAVKLVRGGTQTSQANIIAANNIRTASLTSVNTDDQDTTNVVSRLGDIYLGYSAGSPVYDANDVLQPSNGLTGNDNVFSYKGTGATGMLSILAGYDDQTNNSLLGGGNIYFTRIKADMAPGSKHLTEISIPFSNEYKCGSGWSLGALYQRNRADGSMAFYEHAGIIGGLGRCGTDVDFANYAGLLEDAGTAADLNNVTDTSLVYHANDGDLLVDAGTRGNIIMNQGSYLNFQQDQGNAFFLTRNGDIDLRNKTNVDALNGGLLLLASSEAPNKLQTGLCGCDEQMNNVYLQDFQYRPQLGQGSVFIGADNNIKLQYGGLKDRGTLKDPFLSENKGYTGSGCGTQYHCDSDTSENKARDLILNFNNAAVSGNGGFAAVASDLIDVYKNLVYNGGASGKGMSTVPSYGNLHGESVAGYGLYIKTQANKNNWNRSDFEVVGTCGKTCLVDDCTNSFLHNTARVTFHADARIYTENQQSLIASPVLETFGNLELNTNLNKGSKTAIAIQTDSLICHDSLIIDGTKTSFSSWSNLYRNMPIIKLGHQRFTPPAKEDGSVCAPCVVHNKGFKGLDTVFVTFRNDASLDRLHTLVADHAVISFLTDSFDHMQGNPVVNAQFYTDTFKVRNQVELFGTNDHTHDGHFELISEPQMLSKEYAGIYARHLHLEPIAPECKKGYSELWLKNPALKVITTASFGGFGTIHADVNVEIGAKLAPGYSSLGKNGNCYEQKAGTLKMKNLRLDKGAELMYSIGEVAGFNGELADCIHVDSLAIYGEVKIYVEERVCQNYEPGCYEIIRYKSVGFENLNNLKLGTTDINEVPLSLDFTTPGSVFLCVGEPGTVAIRREVQFPTLPAGVNIKEGAGPHYVNSMSPFRFTLTFSDKLFVVSTNRMIDGKPEVLEGVLNANGEYEYVLPSVNINPIIIHIGPDIVANENLDANAVWANGNSILFRVQRNEIASIYSVAGQLVKLVELPQGDSSVPAEKGMYIITLKDGSVHKIVIK